jgi:hypothetical protein
MHLTDRLQISKFFCMGWWDVEQYVMNSQTTSWGSEGGGERYIMNS